MYSHLDCVSRDYQLPLALLNPVASSRRSGGRVPSHEKSPAANHPVNQLLHRRIRLRLASVGPMARSGEHRSQRAKRRRIAYSATPVVTVTRAERSYRGRTATKTVIESPPSSWKTLLSGPAIRRIFSAPFPPRPRQRSSVKAFSENRPPPPKVTRGGRPN